MLNFSKRLFSNKSYPITITNNAWTKLEQIFNANKNKGFMFSAEGGGCNGFNYKLNSIEDKTYNKLIESKLPPTILTNNNISVTGYGLTSNLGNVTTIAKANVTPTSVLATGFVGSVLIWSRIDDSQSSNFSEITDTQTPGWVEIDESEAASWEDVA